MSDEPNQMKCVGSVLILGGKEISFANADWLLEVLQDELDASRAQLSIAGATKALLGMIAIREAVRQAKENLG